MEINILNIVGLLIALLGTVFLIKFGVTFRGDQPGVSTGKSWTNECGQRMGFTLLLIGFALQLSAQFL